MDEDEKIRAKAHELWIGEGRPDGRADRHWTDAREIIALEEGAGATALKPVNETVGEPVEPAMAAENGGDVPVLTDLGDEGGAPSRAKAAEIADVKTLGESGEGASSSSLSKG